jgi:peptidoglycan/xylan/chitin deacetylase (PgdA/CDA1 family)
MKGFKALAGAACEGVGRMVDSLAAAALQFQRPRPTVFMFHGIMKPQEAEALDLPFHRPETFKCFLSWITERALVKNFAEAQAISEEIGIRDRRPAAVLTFDDGLLDNYSEVFPLLRQYGLPGMFFIPTALIGQRHTLSRSMIREMSDHGMMIGSHSVSHDKLPQCGTARMREELAESKTYLEDLTGRPCDDLAYPYGHYNEAVKDAARSAGYRRAFAASPATSIADTFALPRIAIPDSLNTRKYAEALYDAGRWRRYLGRNERLDRFVHGTLGYNSVRLQWPRSLR